MTPAQAKRHRAALMRDIARQHKSDAKANLASLRSQVRGAKAAHRVALKKARARCRHERASVRGRIADERTRALAMLKDAALRERAAARGTCSLRLDEARALKEKTTRVRATLDAERTYRRELRSIEAGNRAKRTAQGQRMRGREKSRESDDEVEGNLSPEFVPLWRKVRGSIRGSDRMTRTESFLQYAHDHPREVLAGLDDRTEEVVRELQARELAARRDLRRRPPAPRASLPPAPF